MKFGRNQIIGCAFFGATLVGSYALTMFGDPPRLTGPQWIGFAQVFVPIAVGIVTGLSAVIKTAGVLKGKKPAG